MKCKPRLFLDPVERDHVNDLYLIDSPEVDHPAPIVNMVEIKQICGSPLSTIPEERTWSLDGTHTATVSDDEDFPRSRLASGGGSLPDQHRQPSPRRRDHLGTR
jgi:hypothetical protein